jgi:hypothetical protein
MVQDLSRSMRNNQARRYIAAMRQRAVLAYTREVYEYACLEFEEASQQAHDLGLYTPDGAHALRNAVVQYKYRLEQYNQAAKRFADFLLAEAMSEEEQGCSQAAESNAKRSSNGDCVLRIR